MNRQPRASWLVGIALGVGRRRDLVDPARQPPDARPRQGRCSRSRSGVVLVAAVVGGIVWPGGLLRHDVAPAPAADDDDHDDHARRRRDDRRDRRRRRDSGTTAGPTTTGHDRPGHDRHTDDAASTSTTGSP